MCFINYTNNLKSYIGKMPIGNKFGTNAVKQIGAITYLTSVLFYSVTTNTTAVNI
jgi:hypothetical protein